MIRKTRKTAGVIGLGIIGSRAAAGLRAAGFQTYVWNRTPQPAPNFLATPAEVAGATDVVQIFVADAQALFNVLEAMRERLTSDHLVICSSTVGPEATVEASRFVQETGARFLDAPFTGSKAAAEHRQLVFYVGGDDANFLRAKPVLEANSKSIVRIGAVGDAAILKIVTNMISAVSIQALAEALAIVRKAGLPDEVLSAAIEHNACRSGGMDLKLPKMASGDYETHFSMKHMFKDVQLGIQMANALELDCPAASVTAGAMFGGIKHGWGDLDFSAIFKVYESVRAHHRGIETLGEPPPPHALAPAPHPAPHPPAPAEPPEIKADVRPKHRDSTSASEGGASSPGVSEPVAGNARVAPEKPPLDRPPGIAPGEWQPETPGVATSAPADSVEKR